MTFVMTHRTGRMERSEDLSAIDRLLGELDSIDTEHPDIALSYDGEWSLSVFADGTVVWENVEEGEPRHMREVTKDRAAVLLRAVASGRQSDIEDEAWLPGYK